MVLYGSNHWSIMIADSLIHLKSTDKSYNIYSNMYQLQSHWTISAK